MRDYDKALQVYRDLIAQEPNDASLHLVPSSIYEQKQMYREAVEVETLGKTRDAFNSSGWEGFLRHLLAKLDESSARASEKPNVFYATIYCKLGDKEKAFEYFEKVFAAHDVAVLQFKIEPKYDLLRDDPRYVELLRKIGLEP